MSRVSPKVVSKKQMTVYLNSIEHKAMECLFLLFNNISDLVTSTQNALELLQKSRKKVREAINTEFDTLIDELTTQKMGLLQSLSTKYQSKCKKLQTQLTLMKEHRQNIKSNKKKFEKISINTQLNQYEREKSLIKLSNKLFTNIKKSLNGKKIIISSTIDIKCANSQPQISLNKKMKECFNVLNNTKIISYENKREFNELYGDILQPIIIRNKSNSNSNTNSKLLKPKTVKTHSNSNNSKSQISNQSPSKSKSKTKSKNYALINDKTTITDLNESETDSSSIMEPSYTVKKKEINDELKDIEEDKSIFNKIRGKYAELCNFSSNLKSFGIELTNNNKVAHKNHGNFSEDYILLDIKNGISNCDIKCFRFHHNTYMYALWGIIHKNNNLNTKYKWDIKHIFGINTENIYISNGICISNKIKTEKWSGKLVDMLIDLKNGQLKFCSPNFIEPQFHKNNNTFAIEKNSDIITIEINKNKIWCPILKLRHIGTFVMCREIPPDFFGRYPKSIQFETQTCI